MLNRSSDGARNRKRLSTIFAADIEGYSEFVHEDEENALAQMQDLRAIMDPIIEANNGRIANTAGDSVIAEFQSPVSAVSAAVDIQARHSKYYQGMGRKALLKYRIGINTGEVYVQQNGDILGDGVNIAARLESIAPAGGVCVSENVHRFVYGKIDFALTKVGQHYVKNINDPVMVYSVGASIQGQIYRKLIKNVLRKPEFQVAVVLVALASAIVSVWVAKTAKIDPTVVGRELLDKIAKQQTEEGFIESLELVTRGVLGSSEYFIITDWPKSYADYVAVAERLNGYPVAISSREENQFLFSLSLQEPGHWHYEAGVNQIGGPMIGLAQKVGSEEPAGGWSWTNGEAVGYTAWSEFAPNNWEGDQHLAHFRVDGRNPAPVWDDVAAMQRSFIVERHLRH